MPKTTIKLPTHNVKHNPKLTAYTIKSHQMLIAYKLATTWID